VLDEFLVGVLAFNSLAISLRQFLAVLVDVLLEESLVGTVSFRRVFALFLKVLLGRVEALRRVLAVFFEVLLGLDGVLGVLSLVSLERFQCLVMLGVIDVLCGFLEGDLLRVDVQCSLVLRRVLVEQSLLEVSLAESFLVQRVLLVFNSGLENFLVFMLLQSFGVVGVLGVSESLPVSSILDGCCVQGVLLVGQSKTESLTMAITFQSFLVVWVLGVAEGLQVLSVTSDLSRGFGLRSAVGCRWCRHSSRRVRRRGGSRSYWGRRRRRCHWSNRGGLAVNVSKMKKQK